MPETFPIPMELSVLDWGSVALAIALVVAVFCGWSIWNGNSETHDERITALNARAFESDEAGDA